MEKIRICYFIPSLKNSGGIERVFITKANYLVKHGFEITVVTTEMEYTDESFFPLDKNIKIIKFPLSFNQFYNTNIILKFFKISILGLKYKKIIRDLIRVNKFDYLISMGGKELDILPKLRSNEKIIYECHFKINLRSVFLKEIGKTNFFWNVIGKIRDFQHLKSAKKYNHIVVLTKIDQKKWNKKGLDVIQIPNPCIYPLEIKSPIIHKHKKAIAVGNLITLKGHRYMIGAWKEIIKSNPEWNLHIFGNGQLQDSLYRQILDLGLQNHVFLRGQSNQIDKEIKDCSFTLLTSEYEGLPLVLIESITLGVPIISFDCETGPAEIICDENGVCAGMLVEQRNIHELIASINKMISDEELRLKYAENALKLAKKYQTEQVMRQWQQLFRPIHERNNS